MSKLFSGYGAATSAKAIVDNFTNRSLGFVELVDESAAPATIKGLNGMRERRVK